MSDVIKHKVSTSRKNSNIAEKHDHELTELEFGGVYHVNCEPRVNISTQITHYYEKTTRQQYGSVDLNKDQLIELRDHLNELINHENWG